MIRIAIEIDQSPEAYANLRQSVGSQNQVCAALGINVATLSRRENSKKPVAVESVLALQKLRDITEEAVVLSPCDDA